MQFHLTINTDYIDNGEENPFGDSTGEEVARILHVLAERIEGITHVTARDKDDPFVLRDLNGNNRGMAYFKEDR